MSNTSRFEEIRRFEADLRQCMKCGFCASSCPIYQIEKVESSLARGRNMLVRNLLAGDLEFSREYAEKLDKCTLCRTCTVQCPARADIPNIVIAARADKAKARGVSFPYNLVFRYLLPRRELFGNAVRLAAWFQSLLMPGREGAIRHLPMFLSALGRGRNIPRISPRFLRQTVPVENSPPAGMPVKLRVGYFTGCMTDFVFPEKGRKIIRILNQNGVEVVVPREQGCCGAPVYLGSGDFQTGRKLADANVQAFKGVDYVITDCATCGSAMKEYEKFLADTTDRKKAYAAFRQKIYDINAFLVDVLKLPSTAYRPSRAVKGKRVTWHDPCHLNRYMGVTAQPRQILKSISEIEYVEMADAGGCCGMAGTFSIRFYELSKRIADKKAKNIEATGADIVVTDCPGCEIQLTDAAIRNRLPVRVMHIMDLLE